MTSGWTTRSVTVLLALGFALGFAACGDKLELDPGADWPPPDGLPTLGAGKIIITNSGDDTVSWIDVATLQVVFTQPVGLVPPEREAPHHGTASLDGKSFFVGLSNYIPGAGSGPHGSHGLGTVPGYLLKYDSITLELLGLTRVDKSPGDARMTPDGKTVVVSHFDLVKIQKVAKAGGTIDEMIAPVAIIDAATMTLVKMVPACPASHGLGISPDSKQAFVACYGSDELAIVDLTEPYAVQKVHVGTAAIDPTSPTYGPYAVTQSPSDGRLWISDVTSNDLRIYDPAAGTFAGDGPIALAGPPFFPAFSADGVYLYVPVQVSNALLVIDAASRQTVANLSLPPSACTAPHAVFLLEEQHKALVVCEGDHQSPGTIAVIDIGNPTTPAIADVITVGVYPDDAFLLRGQP
jgi:YVTN family beta-propeller protein